MKRVSESTERVASAGCEREERKYEKIDWKRKRAGSGEEGKKAQGGTNER